MGVCTFEEFSKRPACGKELFRERFKGDFHVSFLSFGPIKFVIVYGLVSLAGVLIFFFKYNEILQIEDKSKKESRFAFLYADK